MLTGTPSVGCHGRGNRLGVARAEGIELVQVGNDEAEKNGKQ